MTAALVEIGPRLAEVIREVGACLVVIALLWFVFGRERW